jgi:hypothetical protein
LFVEVLNRDRAARAHQVVAAMLQQRIHGHHQKSAETAEQNEERRRHPDVVDEVQKDHQQAHADAQRHHAGGLVQLHAYRGHHRADGRAHRHHPDQTGGLGHAVAQRGGGPRQHDVAQIARYTPEQCGRGQRDLSELVLPEPGVAAPEIGQQFELVARHGAHLDPGVGDAGVEPGGEHVDKDQRADGGFGRCVNRGVDEGEVQRQHAA